MVLEFEIMIGLFIGVGIIIGSVFLLTPKTNRSTSSCCSCFGSDDGYVCEHDKILKEYVTIDGTSFDFKNENGTKTLVTNPTKITICTGCFKIVAINVGQN